MLYIKRDGSIELTRGDTARFTVDLADAEGKEYIMQSSDVLVFTVKESVDDIEPSIQKISPASNTIHIKPEDTSELDFGNYVYDVELRLENGDVYTVIEKNIFKLREEVTTR